MLAKVVSGGVFGVEAYLVDVEVDVARGLPTFAVVGLPDGAVKESRDRVRAAMKNSGFAFPQMRVTVNLAPADVRKEGAAFDLPMALAVLAADPDAGFAPDEGVLVAGELSLDGAIRPIRGALPLAAKALAEGFKGILLPRANVAEAAMVEGLDIYAADTLSGVVTALRGGNILPEQVERITSADHSEDGDDFSDVRGQEHAKRALEIAAAGGHNLLMVGPPGTGKTMLARRMATILPAMSPEETVETSCIYSVAGYLGEMTPQVVRRPFRAPHHSISDAGLAGGGVSPRPGEVTLAHNGVLFLDELPEFKRNVLELLRQPLEDGSVSIVRAAGAVNFPARFMLVGAMNPCPCGYLGDKKKHCSCSPLAVERYRSRISGPLLDRFDIRVEVGAVRYREIADEGPKPESSFSVRARVEKARLRQAKRLYGSGLYTNASMGPAHLLDYCSVAKGGAALLEDAMERLGISARAYARTLKVARTIADLEGEEMISKMHILEALQLRGLPEGL